MNLNSLCYDEYGNLVLKFEQTGDPATDIDLENWLEFEYERDGTQWTFPKTKDVVKFVSVAKQTIEHFEKVKLELDVCEKLRKYIVNSANKDDYTDAVQKAIPIKRDCPI